MTKSRLQHIRDERLAKLERLRGLGINPYPATANKEYANKYILEHFDDLEGKVISLTGRLTAFRDHGKLAFGDLTDQSGTIQIYLHEPDVQATDPQEQNLGFEDFKQLVDIGDFIQVTGLITKTKRGEMSIMPHKLGLLTKTLRPLPTQQDLMTDPELIFRRRYIDLATNMERREMFGRKATFWRVNRQFLHDKGFMEVEVPVLEHVTGGADARPFETYMNALDQKFFLRISTELYQKRLIGGMYEKVFTIGPNFRNEGLSDEHLTEYTQIEWYWAYANFRDNMALLVEMFRHIAQQVYGTTQFTRGEHTYDLSHEWQEISYPDVIQEQLGIDIFNANDEEMLSVIKSHGVELTGAINRNRLIDNLWKLIRKDIGGPAFLINEPKFMSPLAKSKPDNPDLTERFHIIIAGSELGNGYSELNDPLDQLERFREQQQQRDAGDDEAQMMDIDYVEMLEYGIPPTSGYAHSERLFWFLEGVTAREGVLFPALKHKIAPLTRKIYDLPLPKREN
jgi:lysyl-tRNA synthetase, class II